MALLGTLVNTISIIVGTLLGLGLTKIPEKIKITVTYSMGLAVIILGVQMGFEMKHTLITIGSLALGSILGEWWDLELKLNQVGLWIERKFQKPGQAAKYGQVAQGFVTATLVFVVGSMGIVGALDSGLKGDHRVLFTKAMLDGFFSLIFATQFGYGVIFSAIPVFLYEGMIAIAATLIVQVIPHPLMKEILSEISGVGGIMILAIGLNMLGITKIKTANMLPSLVICALLVAINYLMK
ncbi:DUF554 domain-containing protein [Pullulanibacillus sp. KACC 23026]|uniref:DUF554 domain-containing protein n=1 Tax=Pullulanibacillus sp. KACC 23026 TaxID=3028315 RepID=UPI0023AEBE70|nr:DUF554 domain-containing protein [Pullulanibacillus sp. KACC 23026]WEG12792.1 DUF554 domain-containing protein [Pullulanibacillus sp. KACC 23026]